ncbi:MAG: NAD(P)H-dependent oxidoreductase subunit E [Chloroflexi bacterium]|nr:NAD(P)H-dependent oxidoreductase subunit E [Chloroflexota bacterium]
MDGGLLAELERLQTRGAAADWPDLADRYAVTPAQAQSTVSFYSFLSHTPSATYDLRLGDCVADRFAGSGTVLHQLSQRLGVAPGQGRSDGLVSLGLTPCTGMCDQGPSALVNGQALPRLTPDRVPLLVRLIEDGVPVDDWPKSLFAVVTHVRRAGPLLSTRPKHGSFLPGLVRHSPDALLAEIDRSGLRGRAGAGFKTALKWKLCKEAPGEHVVVCNADEGEPGTFKDRVLLRTHPELVLDGMTICAAAIGARRGFIYLRGEYAYLRSELEALLDIRRHSGLLGEHIVGKQHLTFDIELRLGAGSYVCGEESALIESLEGKRGVPRIRPPFPVTVGYQGRPTVVNNVETFALAAAIAHHGAEWFRAYGTEQSPGTKLFSVSGDCEQPGVYELPLGTPLLDVLEACGAVRPQAVQLSGAAGACVPPGEFGRRLAYEDLPCGGAIMPIGESRDLLGVVQAHASFFAHESCGWCTPCRVGTTLMCQLVEKIHAGEATEHDLAQLEGIAEVVKHASHCGLGQTAPGPVLDTLLHFRHIYERAITPEAV